MLPLFMAMLIVINPFNDHYLQAQQSQKPAETKTSVHLSEQQWKAVEGIFQSAANKEMYVQFTEKENTLLAKLLWNNNEIHLLAESPLAFTSKESGDEGPIHITFNKDSTGAVNQVNVANNGVWNRTKDYKPAVKIEMQHTPEQLTPFEGLYQLQNEKDRFIQFTVKENKLVLKQLWDGNEISFVPETSLDFFSKEVPLFSLTFTKDNAGSITQMLAFKRDLWVKVNKSLPTLAQLKSYEGKYQLHDDPDNYIQIIANQNHLIVKQLWDKKEIVFEPKTETFFYNQEQSLPLLIIKDDSGAVIELKLFGNDLFTKVK
jgi:hypothetical protein